MQLTHGARETDDLSFRGGAAMAGSGGAGVAMARGRTYIAANVAAFDDIWFHGSCKPHALNRG